MGVFSFFICENNGTRVELLDEELQATGELTNSSISQVIKFSISMRNVVKQVLFVFLL